MASRWRRTALDGGRRMPAAASPTGFDGRRRTAAGALTITLGCLLAFALLAPAGADAACGKVKRFAARADAGLDRAPLAIGDSVLLGAAEEAAAVGYDVDVRGCRQIDEGLDVLRARARRGALPRVVVIALGSNASIALADVRTALRILGPKRTLGLVTPREIRGMPLDDAATLRRAAARWSRRVVLVDWVAQTRRRRGLTYSDGIHLTPAGQRMLATMLKAPLERVAPGAGTPPPAGGGTAGGGAQAP
ncbi:MAG TPA: hypothetical protein VHF88_04570, partial [Thermoleophilaceae bacterium]|nr:hypothetical protein [Thermoleophilaceae bacterium]